MKKIIFYSFNGTHVPTLAALALTKPKNVKLIWYIQVPAGRDYWEFIDAIDSVKQMGFKIGPLVGSWKDKLFFPLKKRAPTEKKKLIYSKRKIVIENLEIFPVVGDWWKIVLSQSPNAIVLPSIRLPKNSLKTLELLQKKAPVFLHEYGNTMKKISAFDLHPERHNFFTAIFTHGELYHNQAKRIQAKKVLTGSSKTDFYHYNFLFPPPINKPFLVYCNTICHSRTFYDSRLSEPEKWINILYKSCQKANFDLVVKLHPNTLFLFQNEKWPGIKYINSYTADVFRQSSGIISDPSTVLAEALLTNKPLFLPRLNLPSWSYIKLMSSACHILGKNVSENARIIKSALKNDPLSGRRGELIKLWWHNPNGRVSQRIWSNIGRYL